MLYLVHKLRGGINYDTRKIQRTTKENEKLKKELEKQSNTTYNYFVGCDIPNKDEATPPLTKNNEFIERMSE